MEGLLKIGAVVSGITLAGFLAVQLHSIYHGGVRYRFEKSSIEFSDQSGKNPGWDKKFWVLSALKGPGKDNVTQSLQQLCDLENGEITAVCKRCGAHQDEMVFRKIQ